MTNGFPPQPPSGAQDPLSGLAGDAMRQMLERTNELARRAQEAGERIAALSVTESSRNRAVTVTAGAGGILKDVRPGPAASGMSATQLCAAVLEAYARASRHAAVEASELMAEATGRDTKAMQLMRAALPPDPDAPDEDVTGSAASQWLR